MLDDLDRALVHALHIDGRAPFARIAGVLGTSTQTVTRRYRRLRAETGLRVVGLRDPNLAGGHRWIVRLTAASGTAHELAVALARRPDTSWVRLTSGGTEIVAIVDAEPGHDGSAHSLLLRDVPRAASITAVSAHYILHTYLGGPTAWRGRTGALSREQQRLLRPPATPAPAGPGRAEVDQRLFAALQAEGRAGYAELAEATGRSPATVARRIAELRAAGTLFFDLDMDDTGLGVTTQALLWLSVAPAHLDQVATRLAGHHELAVVAATTGRTNLLANALCPSPEALHHYLTHRLALDTITAIETAPVLRTLKTLSMAHRTGGGAGRGAAGRQTAGTTPASRSPVR